MDDSSNRHRRRIEVPELEATSLSTKLQSALPTAVRWRLVWALLPPVLLLGLTYASSIQLGHEADALAIREYQGEQARIASLAAERLGGLLDLWAERLDELELGEERAAWPTALARASRGDSNVLIFVHDEDGAVLAEPAALDVRRRAWLDGGERAHYPTVTRPLRGAPDVWMTAVVDPHGLYEQLFENLADDYDAYVWVIDAYHTIVAAPDRSATGTRPFDALSRNTSDALTPLLADMDAGRSGVGAYPWGRGRHRRERLVAYTPVPHHPGLTVAYSADSAAVRARTHALHQSRRRALLWMVAAVAALFAAAALFVLRRLERAEERSARLGQYVVETKIAEGGMGVVYRARHALLRRATAVKLLRQDMMSAARLRDFEREVRATARLEHPNTVTLYDYGRTPEGVFYYAMELLDGVTLRELVDRFGRQPAARVKRILAQVAAALDEAHGAGLVHRDVKPGNIMLCRQGGEPDVVKVLDFGLVRELEAEGEDVPKRLVGTPMYMSPEAIRAPEQVDGRSDLYAVGAVGYFLLAGNHMFRAESVSEVCAMHLGETPRPLSELVPGEVPADLEAVIMACLAKDPDDRPQSAAELRQALGRCEDPGGWTRDDACGFWRDYEPAATRAYLHADSDDRTQSPSQLERGAA